MAENSPSWIKSFSDSEISLLDSEKPTAESGRTRNHSEKNFAFLKSQKLKFSRNRNENNSDIISDTNNQSFEAVISSLRSFSIPSRQRIKNIDDEAKISVSDNPSCIQHREGIEDEMKSPSRNENVLQDKQNVNEDHEDDYNVKVSSVGDLEHQEVTTDERKSNQNSSDAISKRQMASEEQSDHQKTVFGNVNTEISSPYQVLERVNTSRTPLENDLFGEPRCLAIKKYAADEDEDFDLDLNGKTWDYSKLEKEEGELSPDLYRTHSDVDNSKTISSKKARATESNLEFLNKVNRCFRHLEREFSNMHVSQESKRLVGHLRDLLCVVERMKRKLTVLINSANSRRNVSHSKSKADADSKSSKEKDHKSNENSHKSLREENSQEINNPDYQDFDDIQTKQLNKYLEERRKKYYEKKAENYLSQNVLAPQPKLDEVLSKKEHLRRTHSGSKIERQRIRSLFKRQMNLITQQIIQQSDQDKHQIPKKISGTKSASQREHRPTLEKLKTLDDMESFLDLLKTKKGEKITPEDIIRGIRKKKLLKFTTKKSSPAPKTRALPVLLAGAKEDEVIITKQITDSSTNLVQPNDRSIKEQPGKRTENTEKFCQQNEKRTENTEKFCQQNKKRTENTEKFCQQIEKRAENTEKFCQQNEKQTKEVVRNQREYESDKIQDEQTRKSNSSHSLNAKQSSKSNLSKLEKPKEQKVSKNMIKRGQIDNESKEPALNGIEFCGGESVPSSREVIDSSLLKRNSKETKRGESLFHSRASDFEKDSWEIFPENSKKRIRKKSSEPKSSESDSDSQRDQILKKRKRNESDGDSRRKLSSSDSKRDSVSERKSRTRYRSDAGTVIDGLGEKLPEELLTKKLFVVGDKNLAILDNYFCVKVKDNQIYLKKVGKSRSRYRRSKEQRSSQIREQKEDTSDKRNHRRKERNEPPSDSENGGATLKEMEDFLQQLRAKKVSSEKQHDIPMQSQQTREMKFMARIQAKRKAKLMACVSTTPNISEKEAKFLKDLENRSKNPGDSPETESKKQKLMEKIRAETDFIVLSQKQAAALEDDPLSDVKTFLNMIKEAESTNDENSKQFYVSFSLKRSDVKKLENITTGKASALSEESQRLLNSVRAKMRAKKAPATLENEELQADV
ncbi:hypothetical protein AVEN_58587-1 [Araneus ventricosus]|uniref:Uncharacterized protein n=1 Tax=Araneus ventricosus TaxID=182803 RepID=A0A4Y2GVX6_ARAVE|nr:hypothetical protein AVEN_58587-1 [Araneus ventricosus]